MQSFSTFLGSALRWRMLRAATSGAAGVAVQTLVFEILGIWLGVVRPSTAVVIGAEFGILTNFIISNRYVFHDAPPGKMLARLTRFHMVIVVSLCIQWLCVYLAESVTSDWLYLHLAYALGITLGFFFNYTGYKLWVWKIIGQKDGGA